MQVNELIPMLENRQENSVTTSLAQLHVNEDASTLSMPGHMWNLDEQATQALCKFLHVPYKYVLKVDPDLRSAILRYELEDKPDVEATIATLNEEILSVHPSDIALVTPIQVAQIVSDTFSPTDTIRKVLLGDDCFHVDVTSELFQIDLGHALAEVGDITEAGLRFLSFPFQVKQPSVQIYAERLVCSNGMTTPDTLGKIRLKGQTTEEVIYEMATATTLLLEKTPEMLARLAQSRDIEVPGSPQAFVAQIAKETGLTKAVLHEVIDAVNQLPAPVTVWDIQNVFTDIANQVSSYSTLLKLQSIGGDLAFDAPAQIERCTTCERKL